MATVMTVNAKGTAELSRPEAREIAKFLRSLKESSDLRRLESVEGAADARVRVAQVGEDLSVILFVFDGADLTVCYAGAYRGDAARQRARGLQLVVNTTNGVTTLVEGTPADRGEDLSEDDRAKAEQLLRVRADEGADAGEADAEGGEAAGQEPDAGVPAAADLASGARDREAGAAPTQPHAPRQTEPAAQATAPAATPAAPAAPAATEPQEASAPVAYERPVDALIAQQLSVEKLETELGLPASTTAHIALAPSFEAVDAYLAKRPTWEADAVRALLAGMSLAEVRADLGFDEADAADEAASDAPPSDERVVAGMKKQAASQFAVVDNPDDEQMLARALTGSFPQWCVFLHPSQRASVDTDYSGSARVTGGAGTGKTVVLIHRAVRLAKEDAERRVLLTTFTKALNTSLEEQVAELSPGFTRGGPGQPGIAIRSIDALVVELLRTLPVKDYAEAVRAATGIPADKAFKPMSEATERRLWQDVLDIHEDKLPPQAQFLDFLADEYRMVVVAQGITCEQDYLRAARTGRSVQLRRSGRKAVWEVIHAFLMMADRRGELPFVTLAAVAAAGLDARAAAGHARAFTHVLVDEAQDFHPGHWRFVRALVDEGPNDIFVAEDPHQRIYGRRLVLSHFGIATRGRSNRLTLNYRTTRQTLVYAQQCLRDVEWIGTEGDDDVDSLIGYRSLRGGVVPTVRGVATMKQVAEAVLEQVRRWLDEDADAYIGVLARRRQEATQVSQVLAENGIPVENRVGDYRRRGSSWSVPKEPVRVVVWTMHSAKGMEFSHVILAGITESVVSSEQLSGLPVATRNERIRQERALLYVAASRARDCLTVLYAGKQPTLLPATA